MSDFSYGTYVVAATDARGARDGIGLTSQVKFMRDGLERCGHKPALVLLVVKDGEQDAAMDLIRAALDPAEHVTPEEDHKP